MKIVRLLNSDKLLNVSGQETVLYEKEYKYVVCRAFLFRQMEVNLDRWSHTSTKCSPPQLHQILVAELNGEIACPNTKCSAKAQALSGSFPFWF